MGQRFAYAPEMTGRGEGVNMNKMLESFNQQIALNERQWRRFQEWAKKRPHLQEALEEDCCGTSPFTFQFTTSGIGTEVIVIYCLNSNRNREKLNLSIDDDNEWVAP